MSTQRDLSTIGASGASAAAGLSAALSAACCTGPSLAPLALSILGAGGLIAVSGLRPYAPVLLVLAGLMLAYSFVSAYRKTQICITRDGSAKIRTTVRIARAVTWLAAGLWLFSVADSLYGFLHE